MQRDDTSVSMEHLLVVSLLVTLTLLAQRKVRYYSIFLEGLIDYHNLTLVKKKLNVIKHFFTYYSLSCK